MILTSIHINNESISGRLGNQIFIISSIISLAKKYNVPYNIPWKYSDKFNIVTAPLGENNGNLLQYKEKKHDFDKDIPEIIKLKKDESGYLSLNGYLQDYRYFIDYQDELTEMFNIPKIRYKNSCSIHVRRGDYLKYPKHHPLTSLQYYDKAINIMKDNGVTQFKIFSDDIDWCKNCFKGSSIEFGNPSNPFDDLYTMMECENHIIANSTFSWIAAFYSRNKNKIVIKPFDWFGPLSPHNNETKRGYNVEGWIEL